MKLSKQERIGALIVLVILILGLGGWLFVKPKVETIISTSAALAQKQQEYNAAVEKQKKKEPLKDQIIEAYQTGEHLADMFFPELTSYEADAAFRELLSQCKAKVVVEEFSVSNPTTATLGTYFFSNTEVEYALKSYVSQGSTADISEQELGQQARQLLLSLTLGESQTIGASTVSFTVSAIDQEELINFADEVNNYKITDDSGKEIRKAVGLSGLILEYPDITKKYEDKVKELEITAEADGRQALQSNTGKTVEGGTTASNNGDTTNPENNNNNVVVLTDNLFSLSNTVTFYCIERMQDPTEQLDAQDNGTGVETA